MPDRYTNVTSGTIEELAEIVGGENVVFDREARENYARDESPQSPAYLPEVVVKPLNAAAVAAVLELADRRLIPVTTRGAGTGLSGGGVAVHGGILLSLEKLDHILEVDGHNFTATVEPGVTLSALYARLDSEELYYPIYPGELTATVGGSVATNAGGMNAVRYGVTRHNILGLEAALANGRIIRSGGKFVKCSTGYDLTQLLVGSEGTLAVITKIVLKLTTRPGKREVLFAPFTDLQQAIDAVPEILRLGVTPTGIEFIERGIIEIVEKYLERELPYHDYAAFLMVIVDANGDEAIYSYFEQVERICKAHGAVEAMVPGSERAKRRLLEAREKFYHAIKRHAPMQLIDVVVPRSEIAIFVRQVKQLAGESGVPVIVYGHAGDGNVHLHPICRGTDPAEWQARVPRLMKRIYQLGVSLGGTISGEHGIGFAKKEYLPIAIDSNTLDVMREIKRTFDPNNILNPGKIFDI